MNEFNIIGKALEKPELKKSESGIVYALMLVSVNKPFKNKDGDVDSDVFQITMFKNLAEEAVELVKDGSPLLIKGHINANNYLKDGKTIYSPSIIADRLSLLQELY